MSADLAETETTTTRVVEHEHSPMTSLGLLALRVGIGGFMATHGWGKFQMVMSGNLDGFGDPIGIGSAASLILIMFAEFICALLVVFGVATRFAAIPIVVGMAVAAFVAHGSDPWTMGRGAQLFMAGESESWASKEPALLFMFSFLALVFTGAGRYSVDALFRSWRAKRRSSY